MIQLTLHNGEDILVNWDNVSFATPSTSEETREVYTKIVFNGGDSAVGEVDVREAVSEITATLKGGGSKKTTPRRK